MTRDERILEIIRDYRNLTEAGAYKFVNADGSAYVPDTKEAIISTLDYIEEAVKSERYRS